MSKNVRIFAALAIAACAVLSMGLRPSSVETTTIDTLVGTISIPEGYERKAASGGMVKLTNETGITIVVDALTAESVESGGYTEESIKPILAKSFEPKMIKDPESEDGAMLFQGFGSNEEGSVAFVMTLIDTRKGAGCVLVYGPNAQREALQAVAEVVVTDLLD
jgi:hypothetical protein